MLMHTIQTMIQIPAQTRKIAQTIAMMSTKRTFLMRVRLEKDDMTVMIRRTSRKMSRKRKDMMLLMMMRNTTPIDFLPSFTQAVLCFFILFCLLVNVTHRNTAMPQVLKATTYSSDGLQLLVK